MARLEHTKSSHLEIHSITSHAAQSGVQILEQLVGACVGPAGGCQVLRNSNGGHVTVSSSCARILAAMSITRPELKLITTSVEAHLKRHGDGGLFMSHVCCKLILLASGLMDSGFPPHRLCGLFDWCVGEVMGHLLQPHSPVTLTVDLDHLPVLLAYVRSVITSKNSLNLSCGDCDILSHCVLKAFLETIPDMDRVVYSYQSDRVYLLPVSNGTFSDSFVDKGLLLLCPDYSVMNRAQELIIKTHKVNEETARKLNIPKSSEITRLAFFTCSMSGDVEEMLDTHFEVTDKQSGEVDDLVLTQMTKLCTTLNHLDVGIVLCQKVIHPSIKANLRSRGICFIDRLGAHAVPYVQDLTGAQPISSVMTPVTLQCLGWVTSVTHREIRNKSYLHLQNDNSPVVTFMLCASWEEKLAEIKICVLAAVQGLGEVLKEKKLLKGGGCWQMAMSHLLKIQVLKQLETLSVTMCCSKAEVLKAVNLIRCVLESWALRLCDTGDMLVFDPGCLHSWRTADWQQDPSMSQQGLQCCCGLKSTDERNVGSMRAVSVAQVLTSADAGQSSSSSSVPVSADHHAASVVTEDVYVHNDVILDNFSAFTSALKHGVDTAKLVLSVGQFIIDRN